MEQVILRGRDTNGNAFNQNDVVTIYNLDFCNAITVPLVVKDDQGNIREYFKSEVIRRLLEVQRDIPLQAKSKKFVLLLTVHSDFWSQEKKRFIGQAHDGDLEKYMELIGSLRGWKKNAKLLKAYLYQIVKNFFCHCDFTPEFLPVIYYKGAGGAGKENWLMHFTVIGAFNKTISSNAPCFQNSKGFLDQRFLTIKDKKLNLMNIQNSETDCFQDSVKAFKELECYKQLWVSKKK